MQRARPLLGTFVEIRCPRSTRPIERAFAAIETVHRLMSFHETTSELTKLNREAHHHPVTVHPWTWRVLHACQWFHRESGGVFDPTVASQLVNAGVLPAPSNEAIDESATFGDVQFLDRRRISFRKPLWLDLGGIAKGFAVDVAIATLHTLGVRQATVNAGGDLRTMGPEPVEIWLRNPRNPTNLVAAGALSNGACATSGNYFAERAGSWSIVRKSINTQPFGSSVSVVVGRCVWADALTKIVALDAGAAKPLLDHFRATVLYSDGAATLSGPTTARSASTSLEYAA